MNTKIKRTIGIAVAAVTAVSLYSCGVTTGDSTQVTTAAPTPVATTTQAPPVAPTTPAPVQTQAPTTPAPAQTQHAVTLQELKYAWDSLSTTDQEAVRESWALVQGNTEAEDIMLDTFIESFAEGAGYQRSVDRETVRQFFDWTLTSAAI